MKNFFLLFGLLILSALCLFIYTACDDDDDEDAGLWYTGDLGKECKVICDDDWCTNDDQIKCTSRICVGIPTNFYCTVPCDVDGQCPETYRCTHQCVAKVFESGVCVTEQDYKQLQGWEYCPE